MSIAFVTAFGAEYQAVWSKLSNPEPLVTKGDHGYVVSKGELFGLPVLLVMTGAGKANFEKSLSSFVSAFAPSQAVLLGFCGGLSHSAKVGSVAIPDAILNLNKESRSSLPSLRQRVAKRFYLENLEFLVGDMLTVASPIESSEERQKLKATTGAIVVDMEAFLFAQQCELNGISWFVMKTVMDDLDTKSLSKGDLKPGLELATKELLKVLPFLTEELGEEWKP